MSLHSVKLVHLVGGGGLKMRKPMFVCLFVSHIYRVGCRQHPRGTRSYQKADICGLFDRRWIVEKCNRSRSIDKRRVLGECVQGMHVLFVVAVAVGFAPVRKKAANEIRLLPSFLCVFTLSSQGSGGGDFCGRDLVRPSDWEDIQVVFRADLVE